LSNLRSNVADEESVVGVAVEALVDRGDVQVDDVPVVELVFGRRDPVTDDLVLGGAQRLRKPMVVESGRSPPTIDGVLVTHLVNVLSRHPNSKLLSKEVQGLRGHLAGLSHDLDFPGRFYSDHTHPYTLLERFKLV